MRFLCRFPGRFFCGLLAALILASLPAGAGMPAPAKLDTAQSSIASDGGGVTLSLALSRPVPWRVRVMDGPPRLILDFREADLAGIGALKPPAAVTALRAGSFRPGWSRLVMQLSGPMLVSSAGMRTGAGADGSAKVEVLLRPASEAAFAAEAAKPETPGWALPQPVTLPPPPKTPGGPMVVVLDPGHGGIDPGAENGSLKEAHIVLNFALELRDLLKNAGFKVVMTRTSDTFVPLETRTSIARAAGADVFLSLHADSLPEGRAVGATVYTLSTRASDKASQLLAERHDRDDLLAGMDLSHQDDVVARVLMDMARTETEPKTQRLAAALVAAIQSAGLKMHRHPHQQAAFSVLKSPDIPSALIELGFLSSKSDLARLTDPAWRKRMEQAIATALTQWREKEAALRQM